MANARMSSVSSNPLLDAALAYAARGWRVFPLHSPTRKGGCTCGVLQCGSVGKHPRTARGFKDASLNEPTVRAWWDEWPYANVGVATGRVSGIVVLDIDELAALAELTQRFAKGEDAALPDTLTIETGGGGQHRIFLHPGGADLVLPNAQRLAGIAGLDVRGDGGYIVAPASMHASGCRYRFLNDLPPHPLPDWLRELLAKAERADVRPERLHTLTSVPTQDEEEDAVRFWLDRAVTRAYEGNRNATGFWLSCQLRDAGVREARAGDALLDYATQVPGGGYTSREALGSLRQAYRTNRRDPARSLSAPLPRSDGTSALRIAHTTPTTPAGVQAAAPDAGQPAAAETPRFRFLSLREAKALPPPRWLIEDILPEGLLSIIFGEHGSFKSFLALDFALSIATGTPWQGHVLERAPVVYVAGEGIGGMGKRVVAWEHHHPGSDTQAASMWLLGEAPQLLSPGDMGALIRDIGALPLARQPALIVIDTLSRSLAGRNENDQADMSQAVAAADRLRHEFGSHVALIHHKPHGTDQRTRGSTVLPGAADTLISVTRDNDLVTVACPKQKDWDEFKPISLRRAVVTLDDAYGQGESSCVLLAAHDARTVSTGEFISPSAQRILSLLTIEYPHGATHGTLRSDFRLLTGKSQSVFDQAFRFLRDRGKIRLQGDAWMIASVVGVV